MNVRRPCDRGLAGRAYLNTFAEMLDYAARLLVGFVLNPLLLAGLGGYLFGVWQILDRVNGHLTAAGNRPFQTLKLTLAQRNTFADYDEKRRQVGAALLTWAMLAIPVSLLFAALAWRAPLWLDTPAPYAAAVRVAALLLAVNLLLITLVDLPRSVLIGENLGYKRIGWSALVVLGGGALTALALRLDAGLGGVAAALVAVALANGALFMWLGRRYVDWFGAARPNAATVRRFLRLSGWLFAWSLVMVALRAGDVVLLGALDSVETVGSYALSRYAPEALISVIALVVYGVTPGIGAIVGAGDLRRAAAVRVEVMSASWLLLTVAGVTIMTWNRSFLALWVGAGYYAGDLETLLIVVMIVQFVFIRNDSALIDVTLKMRDKVLLGVAAALLSVAAAAALVGVYRLGVAGLCLGFIAGRALLSVGYPLLIGRYLGVGFGEQLRAAVRPALVMALALTLAYVAQVYLPQMRGSVSGWLTLLAASATTAAATAVLAFFAGLSAVGRRQLLRRIRVLRTS